VSPPRLPRGHAITRIVAGLTGFKSRRRSSHARLISTSFRLTFRQHRRKIDLARAIRAYLATPRRDLSGSKLQRAALSPHPPRCISYPYPAPRDLRDRDSHRPREQGEYIGAERSWRLSRCNRRPVDSKWRGADIYLRIRRDGGEQEGARLVPFIASRMES
jgi:hypothetical protein